MLKAVCAGFKETTEPPICLTGGWVRQFLFLAVPVTDSSLWKTILIFSNLVMDLCCLNRFGN